MARNNVRKINAPHEHADEDDLGLDNVDDQGKKDSSVDIDDNSNEETPKKKRLSEFAPETSTKNKMAKREKMTS
ncbi:hypothetical protein Tco_0579599 [Tanacetum coccineum]